LGPRARSHGRCEHKEIIDKSHPLSVTHQAELLNLLRKCLLPAQSLAAGRSGVDRRMDELHLEYPFAGARMLRDMLGREGIEIGRRHVGTLMAKMGIEAIYRKRNTSKPHPQSRIYSNLLRNLVIDRLNQVWTTDMTYIQMKRGFVYWVAIVDWATRKVLTHWVSINMTLECCVEALTEAIEKYGAPEIFNTIKAASSPVRNSRGVLKANGIQIRMDGKGCWVDNVFVERL